MQPSIQNQITDEAARAADERLACAQESTDEHYRLAVASYQSLEGEAARYGRAELSFLRWEIQRGVLASPFSARPGSPWWRAINDRLLRDKLEAALLGACGEPSRPSVAAWQRFLHQPSPVSWYRAHNASVVDAYLLHEALSLSELSVERFMMNVALLRVMYAHALVEAPRLALGSLSALGPWLGDPRRRSTGIFLDLRNTFPQAYPLLGYSLSAIVAAERPLARWLDFAIICTRLTALYEFTATTLALPAVMGLIRDDIPCYGGDCTEGIALRNDSLLCQLIARATRPR